MPVLVSSIQADHNARASANLVLPTPDGYGLQAAARRLALRLCLIPKRQAALPALAAGPFTVRAAVWRCSACRVGGRVGDRACSRG